MQNLCSTWRIKWCERPCACIELHGVSHKKESNIISLYNYVKKQSLSMFNSSSRSGDKREVPLWSSLPRVWQTLLKKEWRERGREREWEREKEREREREREKEISRACVSAGGTAAFYGRAGLADNHIKNGSYAHWCKHGPVLLHSPRAREMVSHV